MYGIQEVITEGAVGEVVNMLHGMIRRVRREMEVKTTKFKEWDYWYYEQRKGRARAWKILVNKAEET
jgi:hypothetical protein